MITEVTGDLDANSFGMIPWITRVKWMDKDETLGIGILFF